MNATDSSARSTGDVAHTKLEGLLDVYISNGIHVFLSFLAALVFVAAVIAAFDVLVRDFPKLWHPANEYDVLHTVLQKVLLVAITAELGLLLLYHRTTAAIEVVIFVIARRLVAAEITGLDLLLGVVALAGLIVIRFYYLPRMPD
ncbi:MAG: hypothetical protein JWN45_1687 [Acidobacteriaceae bacterium]|nr:hypothetical protein [Acidobacteriaceae bacterium]